MAEPALYEQTIVGKLAGGSFGCRARFVAHRAKVLKMTKTRPKQVGMIGRVNSLQEHGT